MEQVPCEQETVFVIDPDETICEGLQALLGTLAVPVVCYPDAEAFLHSNADQRPQRGCLLVDANLPGIGSLAFLRQLQAQDIDLPVVVLASTSNSDIADQTLQAGAVDVIDKPLVNGRLLQRLQQLLSLAPGLVAGMPRSFTLHNGTEVTIRAIRLSAEPF